MEEIKTYHFNNFVYSKDGINYPNEIKFPESFFKYYSFNTNSVNSFTNNYLYFSHPNQLNDILDCSENLLNLNSCSKNDYDGFISHIVESFGIDKNNFFPYEIAKADNFIELRKLIFFLKFYNRGILSLTTNPFNKLMMPHYTNERGFVVEFNAKMLIDFFKNEYDDKAVKVFPINYSDSLKPIDYFEKLIKNEEFKIVNQKGDFINTVEVDDIIPILYISSVKDSVWSYEKEWRILIFKKSMGLILNPNEFFKVNDSYMIKGGRNLNYDSNCLKKLILAPLFFNNHFFKNEVRNNGKVSYQLNIENLEKEKILESKREFLKKICRDDIKDKVYLQNFGFHLNGYSRISHKIENLNFYDDNISFDINLNQTFLFNESI